MEKETLSRKERERIFRRNEIMQGAVSLFAKKGFNATTLDEIAEVTEFGKGTIYNYFENKEEIYFTIFKTEIRAYLKIIIEADKDVETFKEFLKRYLTNAFQRCIANPDTFTLMIQEVINRDLRGYIDIEKEFDEFKQTGQKILLRRLEYAIDNGEIRSDIPTIRLSNFLRHLVFPYLHEIIYHEDPSSLDWEKEVDMVYSVFLNGILINK